jgi:hypothetical protein
LRIISSFMNALPPKKEQIAVSNNYPSETPFIHHRKVIRKKLISRGDAGTPDREKTPAWFQERVGDKKIGGCIGCDNGTIS